MTDEIIAKYQSRLQNIDKTTVEKWLAAESRSTDDKNSPIMTHALIAFQDYLFEGPGWKKGYPDRALVRLGALTKDAWSRWDALVASGGDQLDNPLTLITVDALFTNNTFQQTDLRCSLSSRTETARRRLTSEERVRWRGTGSALPSASSCQHCRPQVPYNKT